MYQGCWRQRTAGRPARGMNPEDEKYSRDGRRVPEPVRSREQLRQLA